MFNALSGFGIATHGLNGDVTPQSIITATKAMPWSVLPGSGGTHIRCNGKADTNQPAVCTNALLAATLDAQGHAVKYVPVQDDKIPD
jgi:branched-chain amino acid transport system substrate-binding protein